MAETPGNSLVSVITPVFNGALYLQECIESVLSQTYQAFEYIIVDNCSTDTSVTIARSFERQDKRVRVVEADEHLGPIQNWNRSLEHVSPESNFVKFVHADDWIYEDCIERMVSLANSDACLGIVSAYRLEEDRVSLDNLPQCASGTERSRQFVLSGQDAGRAIFLEHASILGSPTSVLFRAEVLRQRTPFFNEDFLHADKEACIRVLESHKFGFLREVLTFTRRHNESVTSLTNNLDTRRQDDLLILVRHGARFLSKPELQEVLNQTVRLYYAFLARSVDRRRGSEFWRSHRATFARAGIPFRRHRLALAYIRHWLDFRTALKNVRDYAIRGSGERSADGAERFTARTRRGQG